MRYSVWDIDSLDKRRKVNWLDKPLDHDLGFITGTRRGGSVSGKAQTVNPVQWIETDLELRHQTQAAIPGSMHAPFGTEQTPPLKVKIIGGRYVTVLERPPNSPRRDVEPLTRSVGKPNTQLDMKKWSEQFHQIVTPRQPQQNGSSRSPALPPIPNSSRDSVSQTLPTFPSSMPQAQPRDYLTQSMPSGRAPLPPIMSEQAGESCGPPALFDLFDVLPKDKYLPAYPVHIDAAHYVALLSELEREMGHLNPTVWQQVYVELTTFDRRLSGEVKFNDLCLVLVRNGIFFQPQLLRLLGSLFVSAGEAGTVSGSRVNYEKIISFLSACMKYFGEKMQRNLIISGANIPEPPFELLAEPPVTVASQSAQTASFQSPGDAYPQASPHGVPLWDLLDKEYEQQQMQMQSQRQLPPPPPMPQLAERDAQTHNYRSPLPEISQEEIEARFHEKFYENESAQRDLEQMASLKAQEDSEYSRYRQLSMEQVFNSGHLLDTEALRVQFQRADRNMRGTLSVGQIVDLCQIARVPLEPALVADVVRKLCTHRGGGQYDWQEFQAFVDKLKPQQTGLNVGLHHYARVLPQPEPLPTWPHADSGNQPRLAHPENRDQDLPSKYYHAPPDGQQAKSGPPLAAPPTQQSDNLIRGIRSDIQKLEARITDTERRSHIDDLRRVLEQENPQHASVPELAAPQNRTDGVSSLLEQFQLTPRSKNSKWMERFMQLSASVYENVDSQGYLTLPMARHTTKKQADLLRLMIADIDIEDAMRFSRTVDGRIDTQMFLKRLCRNKLNV